MKDMKREEMSEEIEDRSEHKANADEIDENATIDENETEDSKEAASESDVEEGKKSKVGDDAETGEDTNTKYLRLMADFQNYKKRTEKEKSDIYLWANEKLILSLLNIIDNFERAIEHQCSDAKYAEGMELIFKQLLEELKKAGLEEVKSNGEDFDPNFHDAVMMCDDEEYESGKVVEILKKGYTLNGKLIRAAMVKVNN